MVPAIPAVPATELEEREEKIVEASTALNAQKGLDMTDSTVQQSNPVTTAEPTSIAAAMRRQQALYPPLELETRPTTDTGAAAYYLRKAPQTLRIWACKENGPIRPIRVGANLHWSVSEIRQLLGVL